MLESGWTVLEAASFVVKASFFAVVLGSVVEKATNVLNSSSSEVESGFSVVNPGSL